MRNLPAGWRWVPVEQLAEPDRSGVVIGPFGSNLKVSDYRDSGVPLVFVRNIRARDFRSERRFVSSTKAAELASHQAVQGDVLITKMGDPPGDAAVYRSAEPAVITADCIRVRPGEAVLPEYLAYSFGASAVRDQVLAITRGVAQKKLSLDRFRTGVSIPLPNLAEQRRIVEILEDHLSRLEAATALVQAAQRRLQSMEASTLSASREGRQVALAEVANIQGGIQKQPKRAPRDNAYPFLRVANVTARGLELGEVHRVELFGNELDRLRLIEGDLLVVEGNGSPAQIGRAVTWDGSIADCVHQNHLIRVRPGPELLPEYLEAVWNSPETRRELTDLSSSSSGLHTLSVSKLSSLYLPVPRLESQSVAIAAIREVRDSRRRLDIVVKASITRSEGLKRGVLAAVFSGRLTGGAHVEHVEEIACV